MEHNHLHDHAAALPAQMPPESQLADVAELFKIFGDLTRVRIIFVLFQHEECVMDIAQKLEMTQSAISHQLRVLKQSRLVTSRREKAKLPTHIDVQAATCGLTKDSVVLLEQIRTLDKRRLKDRMGELDEPSMTRVDHALQVSFGLPL